MKTFRRVMRMAGWSVLLIVTHLLCGLAHSATDPLLDATWSEARALATDWKIGDVKLQVRGGDDVFVATNALIVVGEEFLEKTKAGPNPHDSLLFALLHELWHVHQINLEPAVYGTVTQRPVLECAADARAAFTIARQKYSVLDPDAAVAKGEAVAEKLAAIPEIPTRFPGVSDATAASLKHLAVDQRRFASQIGVLLALVSEGVRHPSEDPPGVFGRLLRQSNQLLAVVDKQGQGDQERIADICSYIANGGDDKQVRVSFLSIETLPVEGTKRVVIRREIENLRDRAITYSFLLVDGLVEKARSDRDMTRFTSMRRFSVDVPARGKATFSTFQRLPAINLATSKHLPAYEFGTLDRVTTKGERVLRPTCFDNAATASDAALDRAMKTAIRIGQSAFAKFEGIRGEEDMTFPQDLGKAFRFIFDAPDRSSGAVHFSKITGNWSAAFEIYKGDDKKEALKVINQVEEYAKRYCPAPEDPTFPIYWRDPKTNSLTIRRFTTGSSAQLVLEIPEPDEETPPEYSVYWSIAPALVD